MSHLRMTSKIVDSTLQRVDLLDDPIFAIIDPLGPLSGPEAELASAVTFSIRAKSAPPRSNP